MRYLQAGEQQLVVLDPDNNTLRQLVHQAGYSCKIFPDRRRVKLEVTVLEGGGPLLLFDASDPSNLGWFSRCQFYVDSVSGVVLQTPLVVSNCFTDGKLARDRVSISVATELPAEFRLPGKRGLTEQVVYALIYNLLTALRETGVALCGAFGIQPLTGGSRRKT
ncbi:MAG: hypothetical protein OXH99_13180 [Bryobacterales bacterium]|nr:hypothetical protein [Bryobacterales bacterium]